MSRSFYRSMDMSDRLRCSFCHKAQDVVGKLISSPSDYPRAYICDECIAVCCQIIEDDNPSSDNALLAEFLDATEQWLACEDRGQDTSEELSLMRTTARRLFKEPPEISIPPP